MIRVRWLRDQPYSKETQEMGGPAEAMYEPYREKSCFYAITTFFTWASFVKGLRICLFPAKKSLVHF